MMLAMTGGDIVGMSVVFALVYGLTTLVVIACNFETHDRNGTKITNEQICLCVGWPLTIVVYTIFGLLYFFFYYFPRFFCSAVWKSFFASKK